MDTESELRETSTLTIGADGACLGVSPCQKRLRRPALVPRLVGGTRPMLSRRSVRKTLLSILHFCFKHSVRMSLSGKVILNAKSKRRGTKALLIVDDIINSVPHSVAVVITLFCLRMVVTVELSSVASKNTVHSCEKYSLVNQNVECMKKNTKLINN